MRTGALLLQLEADAYHHDQHYARDRTNLRIQLQRI